MSQPSLQLRENDLYASGKNKKVQCLSTTNVVPHMNNQNWSPNYLNGVKFVLNSLDNNYKALIQLEKEVLQKYNDVFLIKLNNIKSNEYTSVVNKSLFKLQNQAGQDSTKSIDAIFSHIVMTLEDESQSQLEIAKDFETQLINPLKIFIGTYQSFIARSQNTIYESLQNYEKCLGAVQSLSDELHDLIDDIKEYKIRIPFVPPGSLDNQINTSLKDLQLYTLNKSYDKPLPHPTSRRSSSFITEDQIIIDIDPLTLDPFKSHYEAFIKPVQDFKQECSSLKLGLNGLHFESFVDFQNFLADLKDEIFLEKTRIFLTTYTDVFKVKHLIKHLEMKMGFDYLTIESIINHLHELKIIKFPSKKLSIGYKFKIDDEQIYSSWSPLFHAIVNFNDEDYNSLVKDAHKAYKEQKLRELQKLESERTRKLEAELIKRQQNSSSDMIVKTRSTTIPSFNIFNVNTVDYYKEKLEESIELYKTRYDLFLKYEYELLKKRGILESDIFQLNNNIERKEFERIQTVYRVLSKYTKFIKLVSANLSSSIHSLDDTINQDDKLVEFHKSINSMSSGGYYVPNIRNNEFLPNVNINELNVFPNINKSIVLFGNDLSLQVKVDTTFFNVENDEVERFKSLPYIIYWAFELIKDEKPEIVRNWWLQPYSLIDVYRIRELYFGLILSEMDPKVLDWSLLETPNRKNEFQNNKAIIQNFTKCLLDKFNNDKSKLVLLLKIFLLELNLSVIPPVSMALENFHSFKSVDSKERYLREVFSSMDRCSLATLLFIFKKLLEIGNEQFIKDLSFNTDIPIVHFIYRPIVFHQNKKSDHDVILNNDKFITIDRLKYYDLFKILIEETTLKQLTNSLFVLQRKMEKTQRQASQNFENYLLKTHSRQISSSSFKDFELSSPGCKNRTTRETFQTNENGFLTVGKRGKGIDMLGSISRFQSPSTAQDDENEAALKAFDSSLTLDVRSHEDKPNDSAINDDMPLKISVTEQVS